MKLYTVKQVAKLSGVTVRALHHYDQVGLLKPAQVGENGYRYYGREELLRLQQILFHRELELPLEAIADVLDQPGFDRLGALRRHRKTLSQKASRYRRLIQTLDRTLAALEGETDMNEQQLYEGFAPEKQAEYEAQIIDRFGDQARASIEASKKAMKGWSKADWERTGREYAEVEAGLGKALADGLPADSDQVRALIRRHHAWVAVMWNRRPSREAYAGLGQMYTDHPDFHARYEAVLPGLAEYLAGAMRSFAERELA
ncbi:MAG TPA: MerR family transcriptional regulator [Caulobacteraceae bacterium]